MLGDEMLMVSFAFCNARTEIVTSPLPCMSRHCGMQLAYANMLSRLCTDRESRGM